MPGALEGLLTSQTAAPQGGVPQQAQAPQPSAPAVGGQGIGPASSEDIAQFGLPPGTLEIRIGQDDPAFRSIAAKAAAEGGQIVSLGGKTFAVPPQQQQPAPQGLLAGGPQAAGPLG